MVNSPLIRPYLLGGWALGGGTLDSHDDGRSILLKGFVKHNDDPFLVEALPKTNSNFAPEK